MRWLILSALLLAASLGVRAEADEFDALAGKIRQAELRDPGVPTDLSLYADTVTYGHNVGEARTGPAAELIPAIGVEQDSFKRFVADRQVKLIRFVASGGNVVAETEMTGTLPDRTQFDTKTAIFFTIADGKIARVELWADPTLGRKFAAYMAKDPEVAAMRRQRQ